MVLLLLVSSKWFDNYLWVKLIINERWSSADLSTPGYIEPTENPPSEYKDMTFMIDFFDGAGNSVRIKI